MRIKCSSWNVLSILICRVAYLLLQSAACTLLDILLLVQRKSAECSLVSLTQLVSAPFDEDLSLTLRFETVEVNASFCLPSFVPSASDDWNL